MEKVNIGVKPSGLTKNPTKNDIKDFVASNQAFRKTLEDSGIVEVPFILKLYEESSEFYGMEFSCKAKVQKINSTMAIHFVRFESEINDIAWENTTKHAIRIAEERKRAIAS